MHHRRQALQSTNVQRYPVKGRWQPSSGWLPCVALLPLSRSSRPAWGGLEEGELRNGQGYREALDIECPERGRRLGGEEWFVGDLAAEGSSGHVTENMLVKGPGGPVDRRGAGEVWKHVTLGSQEGRARPS